MTQPRRQWIPFSPAVDTAAEWGELLLHARGLARAAELGDTVARLGAVDELRHSLAGRHVGVCTSAAVRAAVLLMADLIAQGWSCRVRRREVWMAKPEPASDLVAERERLGQQLHVERDRQLQASAVQEFLAKVERRRFHRGRWVSIYSLMRDGADLAQQLGRIRSVGRSSGNPARLQELIRPYIQAIHDEEVCERTGLPLRDIWRYFRHTWANPYRSVPGRSVLILVRDAAIEPHPVIGIAALASSAVQIGVRDEWIGWSPETYVDRLRQSATERHAQWLLRLVDDGVREIYQDDLLDPDISPLTRHTITAPTDEVIEWLEKQAREHRSEHQRLADANEHKRSASAGGNWEDDRWRRQAETPLFRSKRAETLAMLLRARAVLQAEGRPLTASTLQLLLSAAEARQAVQSLVRRAKSERIGVAMADISVCGAVAPYSVLLGGKLVAMLAASPEVVVAYRERYGNTESVIASSLAGRPVIKPPHLVFLGTTSLYGTEPTQYTRVYIPCERAGGRRGETVCYRHLGRTEGYGSLQFSPETVKALSTLLSQSQGGQRVHSIFGEGVNPRLRKIREGLDRLRLPSDELLSHGSPRLVYGVTLARNFREYLLGLDTEPDYLLPLTEPTATTSQIVGWWIERWLARRLQRDDVLSEVARHQLRHPVRHGARVSIPPSTGDQLLLFGDIEG